MKTATTQNHSGNLSGIISFRITLLVLVAAMALLASSCITTAASEGPGTGVGAVPPSWAPEYGNISQVRYYYLPDIEAYYDVFNHEFVYMDNGSWMFSPTLPPMYSWYDLYGGYTVVLNYRVHQPWMHFHYYLSNYPRYYYQTVYRNAYGNSDRLLRGFNENTRSVVYHNSAANDVTHTNNAGSQTRVNNADNANRSVRNSSANRGGATNNNSARQMTSPSNAGQNKSAVQSRPSQRMTYYGRHIGRPVKVTRKMSGGHGGKHRGR